jgi:hypothetical protein
MTLHVTRDGQKVTIHGNLGLGLDLRDSKVFEFTVDEHFMHLRSFWGQLGGALDEAEREGESNAG